MEDREAPLVEPPAGGFLSGATQGLGWPPSARPRFDMRSSVTSVPKRDRPMVFSRLNAQNEAFRRLEVDEASRKAQLAQLQEEAERDPETMARVRARLAAPGPAAPRAAERLDLTLGESLAGGLAAITGGRPADAARAAVGMGMDRQAREFANRQAAHEQALDDRRRTDQADLLELQGLGEAAGLRRQEIAGLRREGRDANLAGVRAEFDARIGDIESSERRDVIEEGRTWDAEQAEIARAHQVAMADTAWGRALEERGDGWARLVAAQYAEPPRSAAEAVARVAGLRAMIAAANERGAGLPELDAEAEDAILRAGEMADEAALRLEQMRAEIAFGRGEATRGVVREDARQSRIADAQARMSVYPTDSPQYAAAYADYLAARALPPSGGQAPPPMAGQIGPLRPGMGGTHVEGGFPPPAMPSPAEAAELRRQADAVGGMARAHTTAQARFLALARQPVPLRQTDRARRDREIRAAMVAVDQAAIMFQQSGLPAPPVSRDFETVWAAETARLNPGGAAARPRPRARPRAATPGGNAIVGEAGP